MSAEKNDLYQLCENIVLNDELNEDSIRQLAEYINNTPHASECWPANILIDPLKKVWEDGKVEQSEIAYLQCTLENIVKKEAKGIENQNEYGKSSQDVGVEELIDKNRSVFDQVAALESIGYLQDEAKKKYQKTDSEKARQGCGLITFITIISVVVLSGNVTVILSVLGLGLFVFLLSKIRGGFGGGCGGGCGGCGGGD